MLNRDGQPLNLAFNASLRADRDVDELMGLCKGVLADGAVNVLEAKFLADWFERHRECALEWPANVLYQRLETMLRDGRLDLEEEKELLGVLINLTGGDASCLNAAALTIGLPIDNPAPSISFPSRKFCFTGKFLLGTRSKCLSFIENLV